MSSEVVKHKQTKIIYSTIPNEVTSSNNETPHASENANKILAIPIMDIMVRNIDVITTVFD